MTNRIRRIIVHPANARRREMAYDFALLELSSPVQFNDAVRPICLPSADRVYNAVPQQMVTTGWGASQFTVNSHHNQNLQLTRTATCRRRC